MVYQNIHHFLYLFCSPDAVTEDCRNIVLLTMIWLRPYTLVDFWFGCVCFSKVIARELKILNYFFANVPCYM